MYVKAAAEYGKSMTTNQYPRELHFIDVKPDILDLVKASAEKYLRDPGSIDHRSPQYKKAHPEMTLERFGKGQTVSRSYHKGQGQVSSTSNTSTASTLPCRVVLEEKNTFQSGCSFFRFVLGEKFKVLIFKGDVEKANTDAVVCGLRVENGGTSSTGYIAKTLSKAGGIVYQKSFKEKLKQNTKSKCEKNVFQCKGGNLNVKSVIHVKLKQILDASKEELQFYGRRVDEVLTFASEKKYSTIVLPMIGTGE